MKPSPWTANADLQADGNSIIYQGTSDKNPDIVPHVTFTLDGKDATAEEIKNAQGVVTMDVSFTEWRRTFRILR